MPRIPTKLSTDMAIRKLKAKPCQEHPIRYAIAGDPRGLYIQVSPSGAKSWLLRVTTGCRPHRSKVEVLSQIRREFGLGSYPTVSLQAARARALQYLEKTAQGLDPVAERRAALDALKSAQAKLKSFAQCEVETLRTKSPGYKNKVQSAAEWRTRMDLHVLPTIGERIIGTLTVDDVASVLEPLWRTKYPTAKKLLHDISAVFRYAKAKKLYSGENPATSEALEPLLGKPSHKKRHFPSLPYERVGEFLAELRCVHSDAALALEFAILTAARSDEVRSAPWSEFDLEKAIWKIPAARMKRARDHFVPLSDPAIALLSSERGNGKAYPFANRRGEPLSDMALSALIKRMHLASVNRNGPGFVDPNSMRIAVPHGFRSSFKDWARNLTNYPDEVSELALAHVNSDATRAAYARDALLGPRKSLMKDWAEYCAPPR